MPGGNDDADAGITRRFDAIIIGAGQAGPALAARLVDAGMKVAIVERHFFGGTCVNTGCTPTKALVASAHAAHLARRAIDYGVIIEGRIAIDFPAVMARAHAIAANARQGVEDRLRNLSGCTVITGHARFIAPGAIEVNGEHHEAERIFINVGARALVPKMPGIGDVDILTNSSLLRVMALPRHLAIVGGSYVGLEFAQMFRRFGAEVTVVEKGPRLIAHEDENVSAAVREILEVDGVIVRTGAECIDFKPGAAGAIRVGLDCDTGDHEVIASHVLLAVGRMPNTADLGLDAAGIATDAHAHIVVDDRLETNVPGVWAMGDCNGRGAFTHTAYNDFEIVADNLLKGADRKVSDRIDCYALYIDPPLARVGLSAQMAITAGHLIKVGHRPMNRVNRAVEKGETSGFMEIVTDARDGRILGGTILGTGGDEAIHGILDVMANGASAQKLRDTVHIHPTVSELLPTIAKAALASRT